MLEEWELKRQDTLCKMVRLIGELRKLTQENGCCVLVCQSKVKPLKAQIFYAAAAKKNDVLPDHIVKQFWS